MFGTALGKTEYEPWEDANELWTLYPHLLGRLFENMSNFMHETNPVSYERARTAIGALVLSAKAKKWPIKANKNARAWTREEEDETGVHEAHFPMIA